MTLIGLRTTPCFMKTQILEKFDLKVKESLISILNISLPQRSYLQATLPIAQGGLGIRSALDIALAGFLSSVCATVQTVQSLIPPNLTYTYDTNEYWNSAFSIWSQSFGSSMPELKIYQSSWDKVIT